TAPFAPTRVQYIVDNTTIGPLVSPEDHQKAKDLIAQNVDVFMCSLSEVLLIPGAQMNLNVPADVKLNTRLGQRPLNPPQKVFLHKWTDQMIEAGMVESATIERIKHVAPTVLTQKAHDATGGMTLDDIKRVLNEQCYQVGVSPHFSDVPTEPTGLTTH
ncbi:hypothetical protein EV363DRAFT_1158490, partial [Boletus edulis]